MKPLYISALILLGCTHKETGKLSLIFKGSTTSNEIVNELAAQYNEHAAKKVHVLGGGSEEAAQEFISGKLLYLNSSRKLTAHEIGRAEDKHRRKVKEIIIGLDAIAIIVNPKLGVHELSLTQLSAIFQGKISNWQEVGGRDLAITIYGRKKSSGTCHFMKDKFAPNGFSQAIIEKKNAKEIVTAVKSDVSAISYVDLASISNKNHFPLKGIWTINIAIEGGNSITPFERLAVLNGHYPLTRPLYQYLADYEDSIANNFIKFELSELGQALIESKGFLKILPMHMALNRENGF